MTCFSGVTHSWAASHKREPLAITGVGFTDGISFKSPSNTVKALNKILLKTRQTTLMVHGELWPKWFLADNTSRWRFTAETNGTHGRLMWTHAIHSVITTTHRLHVTVIQQQHAWLEMGGVRPNTIAYRVANSCHQNSTTTQPFILSGTVNEY